MERTAFSSLAGYTLPLYFFPSLSYAPLKLAYSHAPDRFHRETVDDNACNSYAHRSSPPFYPLDLVRNCFFGFSNLSVFALLRYLLDSRNPNWRDIHGVQVG